MSDFSMFLKENAKPVEDVEYVASKRFVDKKGEPVKWILRPVSSKDDSDIKNECLKVTGRNGDRMFDSAKYQRKVCAAAVVFPNLNNAELQDNYGVRGADNLLVEMLSVAGEFNALYEKVSEISSVEPMDELIDEVKN